MSMIYCHKHDRHVDTDYHEDCPDCLREAAEASETWTPTVELITYDDAPSSRVDWRTDWGVAQWLDGPATATPHWHVWRYTGDMLHAMTDAMEQAGKGGRWAVVCPKPSKGWKSEQHLNEALGE